MIIKKIMLYNFKNFENKKIIEFDKNISFLTGPNGFGKTTIFDALELGITGTINRIEEKKVTSEIRLYNQPFFQNHPDKDVIIKVWLENENESLIIIRHFKSLNLDESNKYAPRRSFQEISCYRGEKEEFQNIEIKDKPLLKQKEIDSFFGFSEDKPYEINQVYPLFNYIQQEEIDFFMKKSESERKDSLGFLLKTEQVDRKIRKLEKISRGFKQSLSELRDEKKELELIQTTEQIKYKEIFDKQEVVFDQEKQSIESKEILEEYLKEIDNILEFKNNFSIPEYRKKEKKEKLKKIKDNNNLFIYIVLKAFLENEDFIEEIKLERLASTNDLIEYYLLEKYINKFELIKSDRKKSKNIRNSMKQLENKKLIDRELKELVVDLYKSYEKKSEVNEVESLFLNYYDHYENIDDLEKSLSELALLRRDLKKIHENCNSEFRDGECPFCGADWQKDSELDNRYKLITQKIEKIMSVKSLQIKKISSSIRNVIRNLVDKLEEEQKKLYVIEDEVYDRIKLRVTNPPRMYQETSGIIKQKSNIEPLDLKFLTTEIVNDTIQDTQRILGKNLKYNFLEYGKILKLKESASSYEKMIRNILKERLEFEDIVYKKEDLYKSNIFKSDLESKVEMIKKRINNKIDNIHVNLVKAEDPQNILISYFNEDLSLLNGLTIEDLKEKKKYLVYIYTKGNNKKLEILMNKIEILEKAKYEIKKVMNIYKEEVAKHKNIMVDLLKIPFYIYTAKILQNYQQGMGIFMVSKDSSEINFLANPQDGNDIMYQLSSGQLAVVSLAFTFALNTTFRLSDNLNFLVIDDPIQDMDVMNMGALVEVIRQSIINRYQIIIATHNDNDAIYMSYKITMLKKDISKKYINLLSLQD